MTVFVDSQVSDHCPWASCLFSINQHLKNQIEIESISDLMHNVEIVHRL